MKFHFVDLDVTGVLKSLKVPPSNSSVQPILNTTDWSKEVGRKMWEMANS